MATDADGNAHTSPGAHSVLASGVEHNHTVHVTGPRPTHWEVGCWSAAQQAHQVAVARLLAGHRERRGTGVDQPVEDFLFGYYTLRPAQLARWHPGAGVGLQDAPWHAAQRYYRTDGRVTRVDLDAWLADRAVLATTIRRLLRATEQAPAQYGCLGLHEWAMVYRAEGGQIRHPGWPLRLGADRSAEVLDTHQLRCSHFDATRFFTPAAQSRNLLQPTADRAAQSDQPGCLHANMDLYKWAYKLLPMSSSELVLDCFRLARDIREIDIRASPYELSALGYPAIEIETPAGKAEYITQQRGFTDRAAALRQQLITLLDTALSTSPVAPAPS